MISKFWFDGKLSEDVGFIKLKASSTNPAEETMTRLVKTIYALSNRWTVITGDQTTYELPVSIRNKRCDKFVNVILLLGGFHLAQKYVG